MVKKCSDFPIGSRVKYSNPDFLGELTGEVIRHFKGGDRGTDPDTGKRYVVPPKACVKVDKLPKGWPYLDSDVFAPDLDELTLL